MLTVDVSTFREAYSRSVEDVLRFWNPRMQECIAVHNRGWAADAYDFANYLRGSDIRYWSAFKALATRSSADLGSICDVGGFWGVWPITLARLGIDVTMTESLQYYDDAFSSLFQYIGSQGVHVVDFDPFADAAAVSNTGLGPFDAVSMIAVLEHYPHSLRTPLDRVRSLLKPGGAFFIEVPNIAYWPRRVALLQGESPLVPASTIYQSDSPFTGHHHEFTVSELTEVLRLAGFADLEIETLNYSPDPLTLRRLAQRPLHETLQWTAFRYFPDTRELIHVLGRT